MTEPTPRKPSPGFYKGTAIVFSILAALFIWAAIAQRSWFYAAFGIITVMNALMSGLRAVAAAEQKKDA